MKLLSTLLFLTLTMVADPLFAAGRFEHVFSWGVVRDEAAASAYAEIGVTDIRAAGANGFAAARQHGMRAYCTFSPPNGTAQVMRPEEQAHFDEINAVALRGKLSAKEYRKEVDKRLKAAHCQFGGEPITDLDVCHYAPPCFLSDANGARAKVRMAKLLTDNPQADGVVFDGIGYANLHSCECADCKSRLSAWLERNGLEECEETRNRFYRASLVNYINMMVDYARRVRPGIKVALHLWPAFVPDPLYGKDLKADYVQETAAWYFPWPKEKIARYTRQMLTSPHQPESVSVPFVGLNSKTDSALPYKSPERLEEELSLILANGGTSVAVCNGDAMLDPGYREVFRRYAKRNEIDMPE